MKVFNLSIYISLLVILNSCGDPGRSTDTSAETDTLIRNDTTELKKPIDVSKINIDTNLVKLELANVQNEIEKLSAQKVTKVRQEAIKGLSQRLSSVQNVSVDMDVSPDPNQVPTACFYPTSIKDLTGGISLEAYNFKRGDEFKLGLMGFLGVSIDNKETVTVVEFSQILDTDCNTKSTKYGIGARLMLRIKKTGRGAKLATPQQITASVIYDKAEVNYSVKTFGIVGPGIGKLIKSGTLSENTYNDFINEVADMVVGAYNNSSAYIVTPQLMPLMQ